jgi:PII-like signaling protein
MKIAGDALKLRVYSLASDRAAGRTLHEAIVGAARERGLAGASVWPATMGFAQGGRFFASTLVDVGFDRQPLVVEVVDTVDRLRAFLPVVAALVGDRRLITLETLEVLRYAPGAGRVEG